MVGINALLLWQTLRRQMGHELMSRQSERDGVARLTTQGTTKSIDVETFRRRHVVNREGKMEQHKAHCRHLYKMRIFDATTIPISTL